MFFKTAIMGNTADLKVQKTIIDTLHKEGKSQRVTTKRGGCIKILNAKLTGRKKLGRKMCISNRDDCKLENTVKQSRLKLLGELHKEWTEAGVSASRDRHLQAKVYPSHFWNWNIVRSILPRLRRKRTGLLLSAPKSSFQIKVNVAFHLENKVSESGRRVERHRIHVAWSFHSLWWFGLPCHLLVLVHCVFWSPQSMQWVFIICKP